MEQQSPQIFSTPPDHSRKGFLDVLDYLIPRVEANESPSLCGTVPFPAYPGDPPEQVGKISRLTVQMEGFEGIAASVLGRRVEVKLTPVKCLYWAPYGWCTHPQLAPGRSFGLVMRSDCLRLIQVVFSPEPPHLPMPWAYHTSAPLAGAAIHVKRALDRLAEEGKVGPSAQRLFVTLLDLARQHLLIDAVNPHQRTRAHTTWRLVLEYLEENYVRAIRRNSVAQALGLHPNYLSALAQQAAGQSFRDVLEGIRLRNARRLLRETDFKLARIALLCGYRDAAYFSRAFRRANGVTAGQYRAVPKKAIASP